jgi:hypothetical protein
MRPVGVELCCAQTVFNIDSGHCLSFVKVQECADIQVGLEWTERGGKIGTVQIVLLYGR